MELSKCFESCSFTNNISSVPASPASFWFLAWAYWCQKNGTTQLIFSALLHSQSRRPSESLIPFIADVFGKSDVRSSCEDKQHERCSVYLIFNLPSDSLQCLLFTLSERKFVGYWVTLSNQSPLLFFCQQEGSWTLQLLHSETRTSSIYFQPLSTI